MNSSNTVLLVIDIINSCAHEKCEIPKWNIHFTKIRGMIPKLIDFIKAFKEVTNCKVVYSNTTPWKKEYLTENINLLYTDPKAYYYSKDHTGFAEEFFLVKPDSSDVITTKNHYDVFTTEGFSDQLKSLGVRYIIAVGIFGDGCVLASICGGFSKGYNFIMLKDLIETTDSNTRQELQIKLKEFTWPSMYGLTMNAEEFLRSWALK